MRRIQLVYDDAAMFSLELSQPQFDFFQGHEAAFRRMYEEQGKAFWVRFIMTFRSFTDKHGFLKDFPHKEDLSNILDFAYIIIHEKFVDGNFKDSRNFLLDIVTIARNRGLTTFCETKKCLTGSRAKNPFFVKETRDVFRRLFGSQHEENSYLKALILTPLYLRFGGSVMSCLRLWLNAPPLDAGDHSYWAPETAVAICKDKPTSKTTSEETDGKENVDNLCCDSGHGRCAGDDKGNDRGEAGKVVTTPKKGKKNKRRGKVLEAEASTEQQDGDAKSDCFAAECCGVDGTKCLNSTCDCSPERIKRMEAIGEAIGEEMVRMMEEASIKKGHGKKGKKGGASRGKADGETKKDVKSSCTSSGVKSGSVDNPNNRGKADGETKKDVKSSCTSSGVKSGSVDNPNNVILFSGKTHDSSDKLPMFPETKQSVQPSETTAQTDSSEKLTMFSGKKESDSSEKLTMFSGKKRPVQRPSGTEAKSDSSDRLTMFSGKKRPVQPSGTEAQSDRSLGTGAKLVEAATGNKAADGDNSTNDDAKTKGILRRCAHCKLVEVERKTFKKCQRCKNENVTDASYYCSRECQADDWVAKHKTFHKNNAQL